MTKIKICGLTRPCDVDAVNEVLPDYIGLVFAKSRRQVSAEQAAALRARLDPKIRAVGVFVDENPAAVADLLNAGIIDMAQLHGSEDAAYLAFLRERTDRPIIKAIRVKDRAALERGADLDADFFLLDSFSTVAVGGTGRRFDWSLAAGHSLPRPIFLSGGLTPESIPEAVAALHPYAVDLSSGVESDGLKDRAKIAAAVAAVRSIAAQNQAKITGKDENP